MTNVFSLQSPHGRQLGDDAEVEGLDEMPGPL